MAWRPRLSRSLQELRVVYCPKAPHSAGVRQFMAANFTDLEQLNPGFPLLDRPMTEANDAKLFARYDYGVEDVRRVDNLSSDQVADVVKSLVEKGATMKRSPWESMKPNKDIVDGKNPEKPHWWPVVH